MSCSYILFLASKFPEPNPDFLIQLFACIGAVLGLVWVSVCVWQKIFPPKNPPHHELATRAELNQLRTDVNSALEEMKNRSAERAGVYRSMYGTFWEDEGKPEEAAKWFEKSAALGHPSGQYDLGRLYFHGNGVPEDKEKAKELFRLAAEQGHKDAQRVLEKLTASSIKDTEND